MIHGHERLADVTLRGTISNSDKLRRAAPMAETVLSLHIRADIQNVFNITCPRVAAEFIST